ncbi:MAG: hypothetical protein QOE44_2340 [Solirubrobacteraceae bacterium]|nr:hypothetical protein [Solirubrobacteraceae bacterium]
MPVSASVTEASLSAQDLLGPSTLVHDIPVPPAVLRPGLDVDPGSPIRHVRLRPLTVATLTTISRAAREDPSLVPLLMIKESLVEPELGLDGVRRLHVGLVQFLVSRINLISGLTADGQALDDAVASPAGQMHVLLARHFGWTPDQVAQLTPGQVAVYLAGVSRLLDLGAGA